MILGGGEAWLIFCAWRYGGEDPWRLYNRLDADYRRVWDPSLPVVRPRHPDRVQRWMYAMAKVAAIMDQKMKDTRPQVAQRRPQRPPAPEKGLVLPAGVSDPRGAP